MCKRLDDSQCKRGASNPSSRKTEGGPFLRKLVYARVKGGEPIVRIECGMCWRQGSMERFIFLLEHAEQGNGSIDWLSGHDGSSIGVLR